MLRLIEAFFDPEARRRDDGLVSLIVSDYLAYYKATPMRVKWSVTGSQRDDPPRKLALLFLPRMLHTPCLHATVMIRLALAGPRVLLGLWRTLLIAKHSIDIQ